MKVSFLRKVNASQFLDRKNKNKKTSNAEKIMRKIMKNDQFSDENKESIKA